MAGTWKEFVLVALFFTYKINICSTIPIADEEQQEDLNDNITDITAKDLYVIKTIVYEVGILTDATNKTDNETETHEEIDLTFFDPIKNGSTFDLSNIPIPIETNISGVSVTGIAPVNFGKIELPSESEEAATLINFPLNVPVLPNALLHVKRNVSASDELMQAKLLEKFPEIFDSDRIAGGIRLQTQSQDDTTDRNVEE